MCREPPAYISVFASRVRAPLPTPIAFEWVDIPAGEFLMGNDPRRFHDLALPSECPAHSVSLAEFSIAQAPVTNAEYEGFVRAKEYSPPPHWIGGEIPTGKEHHPVTNASWYSARKFCQWADARLLSEAEWEKAARGESTRDARVYPWGNEMPPMPCANYGRDGRCCMDGSSVLGFDYIGLG
ncbi:MAG: formylglycine-generating enzyme family protein, partial [Candidatus Latescibacterota bacterium]